ncbi:hypothetical protein CVT25_014708 [Psilocybe cyanescens]|uniref:Uncharacterized protein n=1 Tax=Psilocybe cyanescens TaxID=93625 RepID=A0A409XJZ6_PSICY|nr:hypothetical protein CVT25_014708 [Psilocybe cyanescens]
MQLIPIPSPAHSAHYIFNGRRYGTLPLTLLQSSTPSGDGHGNGPTRSPAPDTLDGGEDQVIDAIAAIEKYTEVEEQLRQLCSEFYQKELGYKKHIRDLESLVMELQHKLQHKHRECNSAFSAPQFTPSIHHIGTEPKTPTRSRGVGSSSCVGTGGTPKSMLSSQTHGSHGSHTLSPSHCTSMSQHLHHEHRAAPASPQVNFISGTSSIRVTRAATLWNSPTVLAW